MNAPRYFASSSAGSKPGKPWAVVDRRDLQDGKGMKRVSFHRTMAQAKAAAKRLNDQDLADAWPTEDGRPVGL